MEITHFYDVSADWIAERKGKLSSESLPVALEVATPPPFPGGIEGIWSPEHFFLAAIDSCLMTTFLAIAENSKLEFTQFHSKAIGKLEKVDGKYMISEVELVAELEIPNEKDRDKAERILHKSDAACLISNSIKSKISFRPTVHVTATSPV